MRTVAAVVVLLALLVALASAVWNINLNYSGSFDRFVEEAPGDLRRTIEDIARRTVTLSDG